MIKNKDRKDQAKKIRIQKSDDQEKKFSKREGSEKQSPMKGMIKMMKDQRQKGRRKKRTIKIKYQEIRIAKMKHHENKHKCRSVSKYLFINALLFFCSIKLISYSKKPNKGRYVIASPHSYFVV